VPDDPKRPYSPMSGFGEAMGLSVEMVATTAVGTGLGWLADKLVNTGPAFLLLGAMAGGAGGIMRVWWSWKKKAQPPK